MKVYVLSYCHYIIIFEAYSSWGRHFWKLKLLRDFLKIPSLNVVFLKGKIELPRDVRNSKGP